MERKEQLANDIFYKYLEIKQDLINNLKEVFLRTNYYTHKYRGNEHTDINVAVSENEVKEQKVQIFIRKNGLYIKDVMLYNSKGLKNSFIITNIYD
jgi:anti-sigma regulatory factor (Ser/Thr protein kinase)